MSPCVLAPGAGTNYAQVWRGRSYVYAHRKAYEDAYGLIPAGHDIHHRCGVRRCVNPEHLEAVPHAEHPRRHRRDCGHDPTELHLVGRKRQLRCYACAREKALEPDVQKWKREYQRRYRARAKVVA